jgi:hypothetical protein
MVRTACLSPDSFHETPLAELPLEEALKIGASRSAKLKSEELADTSIRFCVEGLRDWLSAYANDCCGISLYSLVRDMSWHWASYCTTNSQITDLRKDLFSLRREIVEKTAYTDLAARLREAPRVKLFGRGERFPHNFLLPREAIGMIREAGELLDVPFSRFFQVGLAWSLSTNQAGLYTDWVEEVVKPLIREVQSVAMRKVHAMDETRIILAYLFANPRPRREPI